MFIIHFESVCDCEWQDSKLNLHNDFQMEANELICEQANIAAPFPSIYQMKNFNMHDSESQRWMWTATFTFSNSVSFSFYFYIRHFKCLFFFIENQHSFITNIPNENVCDSWSVTLWSSIKYCNYLVVVAL